MTYDLRRLRLHGLIERVPHSHRYTVTVAGFRIALCYQRTHARLLRPALSVVFDPNLPGATRLNKVVDRLDQEIQHLWEGYAIAA